MAKAKKAVSEYIPMPPGITYWEQVTVRSGVEQTILQPTTKPLAACELHLTDEDVLALWVQITRLMRERKLPTNVA
jgi:hypothetical protein